MGMKTQLMIEDQSVKTPSGFIVTPSEALSDTNANPSSPTPSYEFLNPKKKLKVESWIKNSKNVDLLADSDIEFKEEIEEGEEGEWLDIEEPLDLVDTCEESVYESLIKEMPRCSLNYDFRIEKGDPRNLKIHCMIGHKLIANAYIDVALPMNIMSLAHYNSIRKNRYEYRGQNFVGLGKDMHVFVGSLTCLAINRKHGLMTFTNGIREVTFKTPYKDPKRSELTSEGHDLLSSRVILSEDDYDRGCRKSSDLENEFYRGTIKLGPEYRTGLDESSSSGRDENQRGVTKLLQEILSGLACRKFSGKKKYSLQNVETVSGS
ncbi:hypothetical protein Tco_1112049 [Tanacetum coccineum]|uniref:Uncharacterized protein n=1 Tax=Tanacetum coccineum TaxID=301880 RepID=A0ABQ5INT8_9ASTR